MLDQLIKAHFPKAEPVKVVKYSVDKAIAMREVAHLYDEWISIGKIKESFDGFEKKKSPGPDGIKPVVFGCLTEEVIVASLIRRVLTRFG